MVCTHCNAENVQGARFCSQCGRSLAPPGQPSILAIDRMIEDYLRQVDKNPSDAMAHYNLALAYRLKGMDDLAEMTFKKVRELSPDFADVHYQLALLFRQHGRIDEAKAAAAKALELEASHEGARRLLHQLGKE